MRSSSVPATRASLLAALALSASVLLVSCTKDAPAPGPTETEIPAELRQNSGASGIRAGDSAGATPMAQRVATIGLLNKRNNLTQDLKLKPGESQRQGNVIVRLAACERTPPWEVPRETGAFVQVLVQDVGGRQEWRKIFSGWLFKQSPSLNVVEHPIYDVWVKDCAMSFPGEEGPAPSPSPAASRTPVATPSPTASPSEAAPTSAE